MLLLENIVYSLLDFIGGCVTLKLSEQQGKRLWWQGGSQDPCCV